MTRPVELLPFDDEANAGQLAGSVLCPHLSGSNPGVWRAGHGPDGSAKSFCFGLVAALTLQIALPARYIASRGTGSLRAS